MNVTLKKLAGLLQSNDMELRIAAIRVVSEIGLATQQTIQAIGHCLREPQDELRLVALKGLAKLGAHDVASMVVPLILSTGPLREHAMAVISAVGPSVIPQLKVLYPQADFHGKRAVITVLSRIGGQQALSFLLRILPGEPFEIQKHLALCICESLDRMSPVSQAPVLTMVLRLMRQKEMAKYLQILVTGAILLGHFRGQSLATKAQAQLKLLSEKKYPPEVRRHAILSYNRLISEGKMAKSDYQFLFKAVCDEDWHNVAQHALQGFQRLELPPKFLPKLVDLLHRSPHFSVHIHVFERLQVCDRREVAEAVMPFLSDSRFRVREAAESALRKMPTSIESLFSLLMKTDDLEVTQRINSILRDFPQETRQKYVDRAVSKLMALFEANDPHYKSFLEFVRSLDPDPLRKCIYVKAHALKKSRAHDKWERISAIVQLLWDHHLITAEGRYLLAVAHVRLSSKDLAPASRRSNLGLRVLRALIYDDYEDLTKRLFNDKDLGPEDYYYIGFHFAEEGEDLRPFATAMLEHAMRAFPRSAAAAAAAHKLQLMAKAAIPVVEPSSKGKGRGSKKRAKADKVPAPGPVVVPAAPQAALPPLAAAAPQAAGDGKAARPAVVRGKPFVDEKVVAGVKPAHASAPGERGVSRPVAASGISGPGVSGDKAGFVRRSAGAPAARTRETGRSRAAARSSRPAVSRAQARVKVKAKAKAKAKVKVKVRGATRAAGGSRDRKKTSVKKRALARLGGRASKSARR
jgi:hypothetical protein